MFSHIDTSSIVIAHYAIANADIDTNTDNDALIFRVFRVVLVCVCVGVGCESLHL